MKSHRHLFLGLSLLLLCFSGLAQSDTLSRKAERQKIKIKKGWNFGALPTITFNTDLGFQYGALINLFDYGDGSSYPVFLQSLYAEVSRYTKGSGINRLYWDTKKLIPGVRMITDLSYITDRAFDFYGFNGYQASYQPTWTNPQDQTYLSRLFYKYDRSFIRFSSDFRWSMGHPDFEYFAGFSYLYFQTKRIDVHRLNKGKKEEKQLPDTLTLFDRYRELGLITDKEAPGGHVAYLKIGASYDTRDHEQSPNKGIWTEAILSFSPGIANLSGFGHAIFALSHRQYIPLFRTRLVALYRVGIQQKIAGHIPYFLAQNLSTVWLRRVSNEGLGGATTLRGILRNRVVGDGIAYANAEVRWRFVNFRFINQNWHLTLNAFFDMGIAYDQRNLDMDALRTYEGRLEGYRFDEYFSDRKDAIHGSYGLGLGIVMNRNFIIALDYGRALNTQDGKSSFYMGINYVL